MKGLATAIALILGTATAHATTIDLYTLNASGTINDAIFQQTTIQPTGTGVIDPFVRIRMNGAEAGFNTGYRNHAQAPLDDLSDSSTRNLLLSDIPVVSIGGTLYRQFLLDINEASGGRDADLLSLNSLQIFLSPNASLSTLAGLTAIYDLDLGEDSRINLDSSLGSGSGAGDMFAYVPDSFFGTGNPFVYLYSQFGNPGFSSNDGFEEWAAVGSAPVPEPGTFLLLGCGMFVFALYSKRRMCRS